MPTSCEYQGVVKVGHCLPLSFCVDAHEPKLLPKLVDEDIYAKLLFDRNATNLGILHQSFNFLNTDSIDLIIDVDTFNIFSVAFNGIDKVLDIVVPIESYMGIVDFILLKDELDHLIINLCQLHRSVEVNSASLCKLNFDIWFCSVESDSYSI